MASWLARIAWAPLYWAVLWPGAAPAAAYESALEFSRDGQRVRRVELAELKSACGVTRVEVDDPYYGRRKSFWACPLDRVLALGFGQAPEPGSNQNFFLRARDGYTQPVSGARLAEAGGHLAFADAARGGAEDPPQWEPIDRRQLDPGPFYLVWSQPHQNQLHRYPWPYQLATIEIAPFESEYPHTIPSGSAVDSPAREGFGIFRAECIACHAINGEGGAVGPDLNVPRSIVEYRPALQIKAFIREPQSFRYTSMPPHPHLSEAQLDALLAYFRAMKELKRDPGSADVRVERVK